MKFFSVIIGFVAVFLFGFLFSVFIRDLVTMKLTYREIHFPANGNFFVSPTNSSVFPAAQDRIPEQVNVLFVGDIMLGRYVETLMREKGQDYPFQKIDPFLSQYDAVIGNLEGPIVNDHKQTPNDSLRFSFFSSAAGLLAEHSFDAVSIANNHAFDQGESGVEETQSFLADAGVFSFGHARYPQESGVFVYPLSKGRALRVIGFHATSASFDKKAATDRIHEEVDSAPDDFVVVFIHWGSEYVLHSNSFQQKLAHAFIDSGARAVIGHHPHVTQEVEQYQNRIIFYSLGNFIFDQYFSKDTQEGLALVMTFADEHLAYQLVPLASVRSQPAVMDEKSAAQWLQRFAERSDNALFESVKKGIITALY